MISCSIPGFADLTLSHLVLDYNGTLALDGTPLAGVKERVEALSELMEIHVVTADTFGKAAEALDDWPVYLTILSPGDEAAQKADYLSLLGVGTVAAVGNGRNDALMLSRASLGMAVLGPECSASPTLMSADVVAPSILAALDLLLHTDRLKATLRM